MSCSPEFVCRAHRTASPITSDPTVTQSRSRLPPWTLPPCPRPPQFGEFAESKASELSSQAKAALGHYKGLLDDRFTAALDHEKAAVGAALADEADARVRAATQEAHAAAASASDERKGALAALEARVAAVDALLASRGEYESASRRVHRVATAVAALNAALGGVTALSASPAGRTGPATQEVAALTVASDGDAVMAKAAALLPPAVHTAGGVPTLHALQRRFDGVAKAGRRAALTPENSGVLGSAVGSVTSALLLPSGRASAPQPASSGGYMPSWLPTPPPMVATAWDHARSAFATVKGFVAGPAAPAPAPVPAAPATVAEETSVGKVRGRKMHDPVRLHSAIVPVNL